ncbi:delta-like protein 3 [Python bivittatus]|uniref:Delta-like protein n=1 Tax=Python bivittatus TaxID=176946 RepID=A0A9F5MYR3_PYTBI|nr:delta-like protein 3 [Python bivittatus]
MELQPTHLEGNSSSGRVPIQPNWAQGPVQVTAALRPASALPNLQEPQLAASGPKGAAEPAGVFELQVHSFTTSNPQKFCRGAQPCHLFFRVCLKHAQAVVSPEPPCTFGAALSNIVPADRNVVATSGLIRVPFHFKWPGTFSLIIESWRAESGEPSTEDAQRLVSRLATRRRLAVGEDWSQDVQLGDQSELRYSYHVACDEHYHGESCSAYCRPRDDAFGHYTCDELGSRICLAGWQGDYCSERTLHGRTPATKEVRGHKKPCKVVFRGPSCDECVRYPGCLHGTRLQPWQCNCQEGWGGLFCNQDLNYCTNHHPCQNGAACTNTGQGGYTCTCPPGFVGTSCEVEINECDSGPCRNGGSCSDLENDYKCTCPQGFYGKNCEISAMTCADGPCFNGGTCTEKSSGGYACHCPLNYHGSNCEKKIDRCSSNPCLNSGRCLDLGRSVICRCRPGFAGSRCELNIDDCARNPCANGGTCIDGPNSYSCSCTLGYGGKDCSVRMDACSSGPCLNSGTCYTHFSGHVCECSAGYMGSSCEFRVQLPTPASSQWMAEGPFPTALAVSFALGLLTLVLAACAILAVLRHLRRGPHALKSRVCNDLAAVNNFRERDSCLISPGCFKVSNKEARFHGDQFNCKRKLLDQSYESICKKLENKQSESSWPVAPECAKDGAYHPIYIIPGQVEPCIYATEESCLCQGEQWDYSEGTISSLDEDILSLF